MVREKGVVVATVSKPRREDLPAEANLCEYCTAKCCKYFALPIDIPDSKEDLDFIRWYLLHQQASVFVDEGDWYLLVHTVCKHLLPDQRCGIYETRPQICRDYSTKNCEYEDDSTYDQFFETPEQVAEFSEAMFPGKKEHFRSPRPPLLPVLS